MFKVEVTYDNGREDVFDFERADSALFCYRSWMYACEAREYQTDKDATPITVTLFDRFGIWFCY